MKTRYIFPSVILGTLILVSLSFLLNIRIRSGLSGVYEESEKPAVSLQSVLDGSYQSSYDQWFSDNFNFREYFVLLFNQWKYSVFEKSGNETVMLGKEKMLYAQNRIQIRQNIDRKRSYRENSVVAYAENIAAIQRGLEKQGKAFCYLISPYKENVYPEYIPKRYSWYWDKGEALPKSLREGLMEEFDRLGVHYYDALTELLEEKDENSPMFFPHTGIHWNYLGVAKTVEGVFQALNENGPFTLPAFELSVTESPQPAAHDLDYYNILNLIGGKLDEVYYHVEPVYQFPEGQSKLNLLYYGTSFGTHQAEFLEMGQRAFESVCRYHYLDHKTRFTAQGSERTVINQDVQASGILEDIALADIVIMENLDSELAGTHLDMAEYLAAGLAA